MEQKIEELAAELKALREQSCCHHGCVHWHYNWPSTATFAQPWTYTVSNGGNYQITS